MTFNITHYGHACVLVEFPHADKTFRALFDPGTYSQGFETVTDLDAIFVTHAHPDHLDVERFSGLLRQNTGAQLVLGEDAASALGDTLAEFHDVAVHRVEPGNSLEVGDVDITVTGGDHACIHSDLPTSQNVGLILDHRLYHPGDAFEVPAEPIEVLLLPIGGPWMKIGEAIDFLRAVEPQFAIPVHQAGLAPAHQAMHTALTTKLAPESTEVVVLDHATVRSVGS